LNKTSAYKGGYTRADALILSRLELVRKYVKSGRLLDVGCAYGFFLQEAKRYFDCYGFDVSNYAISRAKKYGKRIRFKVASAEKDWPYENRFFDAITMWDVIEHLENPENAIKEARRCLANKG
jgi:2-polyprenyl-3-methyl-5-hydroxy-6-metoxy-1,4-benzoquinol methylase